MAFDIDIEDLSTTPPEMHARMPVPVHLRRNKVLDKGDSSSQLPGTSSLWLTTFGCSHNVSDSEYMQGQLEEYGYR